MKAIPCSIVFYTVNACFMQKVECCSINEAIKLAHKKKLPFHIFVENKIIKFGYYM